MYYDVVLTTFPALENTQRVHHEKAEEGAFQTQEKIILTVSCQETLWGRGRRDLKTKGFFPERTRPWTYTMKVPSTLRKGRHLKIDDSHQSAKEGSLSFKLLAFRGGSQPCPYFKCSSSDRRTWATTWRETTKWQTWQVNTTQL